MASSFSISVSRIEISSKANSATINRFSNGLFKIKEFTREKQIITFVFIFNLENPVHPDRDSDRLNATSQIAALVSRNLLDSEYQ